MRRVLNRLAVPVLLLMLWQGAVVATGVPPYLLPGPARVATALYANTEPLLKAAAETGLEVLGGFALGSGLGIALALVMALSPRISRVMAPALLVSQTVPVFALAPLLTLWLGFGTAPKVVMAALIVFFPVASALLDGLRRTPPALLDLAITMGAPQWRVLLLLRLPAALPSLATGLRLAAVYAPVGAVIGEWIGGAAGLGGVMIHANGRMKTDLVFAALLVLVILTTGFHRLVDRLCSLTLDRYT